MKEYNEISNSKKNLEINQNNKYIKNKGINKLYGKINNSIMNYFYLILILILIIIIIVFLFLYLLKMNKIKEFDINKNKNEIFCDNGLFLPEDDKTKCIKCSMENCNLCFGTKLNNICNKCNPNANPIYEDNKIILCSICNEGYYLINDECKEYSFKAKYKSNGGTIQLINSDLSNIKEMIVDGKQVRPANYYLFNDTQDHEVFMLLDMTKFLTSTELLFSGIDRMISISFTPFFNTSIITNMNGMFQDCSSLILINLSNFNTSSVNYMIYMFYNCYSLISINLSNFDTSNVQHMDGMFQDCSSLTSINLSNFNTSSVNYMTYMFYNCYSLISINLSNFNTSNVNYMTYMFTNCSSLISINLFNFDTSNIDSLDRMFYNCFSLASINISSFNTSKVTNMNQMFYNCSSLTSINLSNFDTSKVTDMNYMFYGCSGLLFINILNFSSTSFNIYLFNQYIPSNGTIIINEDFKNKLNITYLSNWNIISIS